jgi:2-oxoisovalerate dehydrogenase E2 component (dihydrolipoyl transacylase)
MFVRPLGRLLGRSQSISYFHTSATSWAFRKVVHKFNLADIGEGITECEVIKWSVRRFRPELSNHLLNILLCDRSVKPTARIQAFDPLCEVQSDKASVEITSPFDGVVKELLVQEGEVAKVGAGLCLIEVQEETVDGVDSVESAVLPPQAAQAIPPSVPSHQVAATEPSPRGLHPLDPKYAPKAGDAYKDILAAPSVRHFARQNSVDLAPLMPGSGNGGRIEKRDVEAFLAKANEPASSQQPSEKDVVVELGRTRYGMWKAMVKVCEIPSYP